MSDTQNSSAVKAEGTEHINLKVVSGDGSEVFFKIKRKTQLKKLMAAYCDRQGRAMEQIRFMYDGERLNSDQTPDDLGMEDRDVIDAFVEQKGGH